MSTDQPQRTDIEQVRALAIQTVGELARGLTIAADEAKRGRLMDARASILACMGLVELLDRSITRVVGDAP